MDIVFLKTTAREQLRGKWGLAIKVFFILTLFSIINYGIRGIYVFHIFNISKYVNNGFRILNYLFEGVLQVGVCRFALNLATNKEKAAFGDAFSGFNVYIKAFVLYVVSVLCIAIGFIFLIVPGIIVALLFSQANYILCEDNSKGIIQCLKESVKMMKGNMFDYFLLWLSFIGWGLLALLTLGLSNFIISPYIELTMANFYLELKTRSVDFDLQRN